MTATQTAMQAARAAASAASDKLATDIVALDVSDVLALTDVFVICSVGNPRQVGAVVDAAQERLLEQGVKVLHREGSPESGWVLLDYPEIVMHVQTEEVRKQYRLERLWHDCPRLELELDVAGAS